MVQSSQQLFVWFEQSLLYKDSFLHLESPEQGLFLTASFHWGLDCCSRRLVYGSEFGTSHVQIWRCFSFCRLNHCLQLLTKDISKLCALRFHSSLYLCNQFSAKKHPRSFTRVGLDDTEGMPDIHRRALSWELFVIQSKFYL